MTHTLAGEIPYRVRRCVYGQGRSVLRPLPDVPGAGEVLGDLGRPLRPPRDVFRGRRRDNLLLRRGHPYG